MIRRIASATTLLTAGLLVGCGGPSTSSPHAASPPASSPPAAAKPAASAATAISATAATLMSGPQVGSSSLIPFDPLHVTGSGAGGKSCLV
jgi:hypothetical protein